MVFYRNFTGRQFGNRLEEIETIKRCNGQRVGDGEEVLQLIELVLNRTIMSPEKRVGYQDTDVTHGQDGGITIMHRPAGMGTLKFEPNRYGNPTAYLAKTPHNVMMLVKSYKNRDWNIPDKTMDNEIKKEFDKFWKECSKEEKDAIAIREQQAKLTMFDMPTERGPVKTDFSKDRMMQRLAELESENKRLKAEFMQPKGMKEEPKEVVSDMVVNPEDIPSDPLVVVDKKGKVHDLRKILLFDLRKSAKEYGVTFTPETTRDELLPLVVDAIEMDKLKVEA